MTPQSPSKQASWDLTQFSQSPSAACCIFLYLINSMKSPPFQRWFPFWKRQKLHLIWAVGGWVTWVSWCSAKKLCTRCDRWVGMWSWWSCQSPVAHSCGLLNHPNSFCRGMLKLNAKFDADSLLYSLSHFECDDHTVHMLTQWHLPPPLTSTVKSSLFTHAHSSPLSLAARLHWCHANYSHYINNGWTFSRQTLYTVLSLTHLFNKHISGAYTMKA